MSRQVYKEGSLTGPVIEKDKLIDNHYYAIANKASLSKPAELNPPAAKQKEFAEKVSAGGCPSRRPRPLPALC